MIIGSMDDPFSMRNLKNGPSPGSISGLEFLRRYHQCSTFYKAGNENHPLRKQEQADTREWLRARQQPEPVVGAALVSVPKKKRVKKEPPRPDTDGVYRL